MALANFYRRHYVDRLLSIVDSTSVGHVGSVEVYHTPPHNLKCIVMSEDKEPNKDVLKCTITSNAVNIRDTRTGSANGKKKVLEEKRH